jgi:hypothetical protein
MNKFTFTLHNLSPRMGLLSLGIMGLWISPILTLNAFAGMEISIDPYNDSGFDSTPIMTQPQPTKSNTPVTNRQPLPLRDNQTLPVGNQNNVIGEVFINGNPTPPRLEMVSGNLIKSNQSLPEIPSLSEPYRSPNDNPSVNNDQDETIEGNNHLLSVSSISTFNETPRNNVSNSDKKPINNDNTIRSIDLSPHSTPSPSSTENNLPSITTSTNLPRRRNLTDILVLSNPPVNPANPPSNSISPIASATTGNVYKVLVGVNNQNQESLVKSLYPEAFPTVFNGQSMLQVGVFSSVNNADDVARSLQSKGLNTEITN